MLYVRVALLRVQPNQKKCLLAAHLHHRQTFLFLLLWSLDQCQGICVLPCLVPEQMPSPPILSPSQHGGSGDSTPSTSWLLGPRSRSHVYSCVFMSIDAYSCPTSSSTPTWSINSHLLSYLHILQKDLSYERPSLWSVSWPLLKFQCSRK